MPSAHFPQCRATLEGPCSRPEPFQSRNRVSLVIPAPEPESIPSTMPSAHLPQCRATLERPYSRPVPFQSRNRVTLVIPAPEPGFLPQELSPIHPLDHAISPPSAVSSNLGKGPVSRPVPFQSRNRVTLVIPAPEPESIPSTMPSAHLPQCRATLERALSRGQCLSKVVIELPSSFRPPSRNPSPRPCHQPTFRSVEQPWKGPCLAASAFPKS